MDETKARRRAKELNDAGHYDSTFVAITKSHLAGKWADDKEVWVVVEKEGKSTLRIVEE